MSEEVNEATIVDQVKIFVDDTGRLGIDSELSIGEINLLLDIAKMELISSMKDRPNE